MEYFKYSGKCALGRLPDRELIMADLTDILLALGISAGLHPYGHVQTGNDLNVPVSINWGKGMENWNTPDQRKDAEIAGGGFAMQNKLAQGLQGNDLELPMRIANALYKAGYMAGIKPAGIEGDVNQMERDSGNKATKPLLGISTLFDLWKSQNPQSNFDLSFITPNGAPGLMGTWRW